jgi:hypothetical protein
VKETETEGLFVANPTIVGFAMLKVPAAAPWMVVPATVVALNPTLALPPGAL